jgi:hypothetical protein
MKETELVTALDLSFEGADKSKNCFQFVYGSQLYGTLFGVYARFKATESDDGQWLYVKSLSLRLLNYQGILNIGFTKDEITFEDKKKADEYGEKGMNIYFFVQGTSRKFTKPFEFETPIKIKKGDRPPLTFNRIVRPLPGFESKGTLGPKDPSEPHKDPVPHLRFFDSEFHYRNGVDYYDNLLRPGMFGYQGEKKKNSFKLTLPSLRCHQSKVILYF